MRKILLALAAAVSLIATGCSATQAQAIQSDVHHATIAAHNAIVSVENNEGSVEAAVEAMGKLASHSAAIAKAQADAQAALAAYKANKGTIDEVIAALAVVEKLTAPNEATKEMPKAVRKKKQKKPE